MSASNALYDRILWACEVRKVTVGGMCRDIGVSRGNLTDLKKGRTKSLSTQAMSRIAAYLDVSMDYLLSGSDNFAEDLRKDLEAAGSLMLHDGTAETVSFGKSGDMKNELLEFAAELVRSPEKKSLMNAVDGLPPRVIQSMARLAEDIKKTLGRQGGDEPS